MMRCRILVSVAFGLLLAPIAYAVFAEVEAGRAAEILRPVLDAEANLPTQGERRAVIHTDKGTFESLCRVYSDGPERREVVFLEFRRDGQAVDPSEWWKGFFRGEKKTGSRRKPGLFEKLASMTGWDLPALGRSFFRAAPKRFHNLELLTRNYKVRAGIAEPDVAGRTVEVISIDPHHPDRPAYRLWVDEETRYPLRFQALDAEGELFFESVYDRIDFAPEFPEGLFDDETKDAWEFLVEMFHVKQDRMSPRKAQDKVSFDLWLPGSVPGGFEPLYWEVVRARLPWGKKAERQEFAVVHAAYTDGAAMLLIVEFASDNPLWRMIKPMLEQESPPAAERGKLRVYKIARRGGAALIVERGNTVFVVAGNLDEDALLEMVRKMRAAR